VSTSPLAGQRRVKKFNNFGVPREFVLEFVTKVGNWVVYRSDHGRPEVMRVEEFLCLPLEKS
jgi:hypothetical protein